MNFIGRAGRIHIGLLLIVLVMASVWAIAQTPNNGANDNVGVQNSQPYQIWIGEWRLSDELNRTLGFVGEESRKGSLYVHPSSFRISVDETIGQTIDSDTLTYFRDEVFEPINHRIVATGKWETVFEEDPGIETDCFITKHQGSTFLWVGAPYFAVYGGKVSFLHGADRQHDVIVLDFAFLARHRAKRARSPDTVAYERNSQ